MTDPMPGEGGHERRQALEHIRQFDGFYPGWYAAPLDWLDANGNGKFIVGLWFRWQNVIAHGQSKLLISVCKIQTEQARQAYLQVTSGMSQYRVLKQALKSS